MSSTVEGRRRIPERQVHILRSAVRGGRVDALREAVVGDAHGR
jgi:hypothetical protein